ncbi:MAG TPA: hypothetical protein VK619_16940 [Pyrinomonadaceae bacterium]|nr:hypothetical protein [Pyrinomonadaceae bacterium]
METYKLPTQAELDDLLVRLLPPAEEMETVSADELRANLEERAQRLITQGADIPPDLLDTIVVFYTTPTDPTHPNYSPLPTRAQLERLINKLLPSDEDMDEVSAAIILEREGVDRSNLGDDLKGRVVLRVEELRAKGKDVPQALLDTLAIL